MTPPKKGKPGRHKVELDIDRIVNMRLDGMTYREIALTLGVSHQTIMKRLKALKMRGL